MNKMNDILKKTPGRYIGFLFENLRKIDCVMHKVRGGSLVCDQVYNLFAYPEICEIFNALRDGNGEVIQLGGIPIGSEYVVHQLQSYMKLRQQEFKITCKVRNLCAHQIARVKTSMGAAMRLEAQIYPDSVTLMSAHWRVHILENILKGEGIIYSDRFTEKAHQLVMRIEEQLKRMPPGEGWLKNFLAIRNLSSESEQIHRRINYPE